MEPIFDTLFTPKLDYTTGRIAMQIGGFYDEGDFLQAGIIRSEALEVAKCMVGKHVFPQFRGGYTVYWAGLSDSQRLIIVICNPNRGLGPIPAETIAWCDENSILNSDIPELG